MNIKEFAELAGVSSSTVSKIMNNKDNDISPETREHVLKLASLYKYRPYSFVLSSHSDTYLCGLIFDNPFELTQLQQGILSSLSRHSYSTLLQFSENSKKELSKILDNMNTLKVNNLIYAGRQDKLKYDENINVFNLLSDFKLGQNFHTLAYQLCTELIKLKHKKIAVVYKDDLLFENFLSGYKTCLFEHNLVFHKDLIYNFSDRNILSRILNDFSNNKFSAVLIYDYCIALELYHFFKDMGYSIPKDLSILCLKNDIKDLKNTKVSAAACFPLSFVDIPYFAYGKAIGNFIAEINLSPASKQTFNFGFDTRISNNNSLAGPFSSKEATILSVGSINMDNYMNFKTLPHTGRASISDSAKLYPGGKGLNQAVACANLGNKTYLIGKVGYDSDANYILSELHKYKISTQGISRSKNIKTGQAYIFVQEDGDSMITIMSGANNHLSSEDIIKNEELFKKSNCCLLQTEIPLESAVTASKLAKKHNCPVFLKPSACTALPQELLTNVDFLIPNITELNELIAGDMDFKDKARHFLKLGVKNIIVTLGSCGAYIFNQEFEEYIETQKLSAIDSSGAGDAFIAALASYLLHSYDIKTGVKIANIAAGMSIMKQGVVPSLATKIELEEQLKKLNL